MKEPIRMLTVTTRELEWGGRTLSIETGRMARQANGAALVSYGETKVLCTAVANRKARPNVDFFPLTVNYQERYFASGKIPGGFFKRERGQSEAETLVSRLIDRPIRPLFDDHFRNETQVIATVLSHDIENDPDIVAMTAASAALALSGLPFKGPIGAARVGYQDGNFVLNPEISQLPDSQLDLVVAGTKDAVMMVESEAAELTEAVMLDAVMFGHEQMQPVIAAIQDLASEAGAESWEVPPPDHSDLRTRIRTIAEADTRAAIDLSEKKPRREQLDAVREKVCTELATEFEENPIAVGDELKALEKEIVRSRILDDSKRIDGRDLVTVRPIDCEVSLLPRTHGSALFTRGETQALVVTTLGTGEDEQIMNLLHANYRERFMLHYNFPPYSVGETRMMRAPGRREIGHGKLAWRALRPVLPDFESFPYTVRIVSEITESNGSSSMATVCGSSLSMMDAGVPLKRPVAGIAMGLILEGDDYAVITDILGDEDHLGDMDFKVAGTEQGVTSLQMDIKVAGITSEIMQTALAQAKDARMHILGEMAKALSEGRKEFSVHAPRIEVINISPDKIGLVKGTGGKTIRSIVEETNTKIDIGDDGMIKIASPDQVQIEAAKARIEGLTAEPVPGTVYDATVSEIKDFGAFVSFCGPKEGLVHVSNMENRRVESPHDVVKKGQKVKVLYRGNDDRGRAQLSMRAVNQETGEILSTEDDSGGGGRSRPSSGGRREFRERSYDRPPRDSRPPRREQYNNRWDGPGPSRGNDDDDWGNRPPRRQSGGERRSRRPRFDYDD